jgi:hypothetical protein
MRIPAHFAGIFLGGSMLFAGSASARSDDVFRNGPETLVAASSAIVAGSVSHYSRQVLSQSDPGPDGIPLKWTVRGQLDRLRPIKGPETPAPIPFARTERSPLVPPDQGMLDWQAEYGDLSPEGAAVLFSKSVPGTASTILPSGSGEYDLAALVHEIVQIQALPDSTGQMNGWLSYLRKAPTDQGRMVALRSLIHGPIEWASFSPALEGILSNGQLSRRLRAFGFGIAAFSVGEGKWPSQRPQVVGLLCRAFVGEHDPELLLQEVFQFKLLLRTRQNESADRPAMRDQILKCLRERSSAGPLDPAMQHQYDEIRAVHPGRL